MRTEAKEIIIWTFYRVPVELMAEMRIWREFTAGDEYSAELRDGKTGEIVSVICVEEWEDGYLTIKSDAPDEFFDRVVGRIVRWLSERSGYLKIRRTPYDEKRLSTPKFKQFSD